MFFARKGLENSAQRFQPGKVRRDALLTQIGGKYWVRRGNQTAGSSAEVSKASRLTLLSCNGPQSKPGRLAYQ